MPAELLRVPAGSHRVVFTYRDRALQAGLGLASATALGLAGLWWWRRRRDAAFRMVTSAP